MANIIEYKGYEIRRWYSQEDSGWKCAIALDDKPPVLEVFWAYDREDAIILAKGYVDYLLAESAVIRWLSSN